MLFLQLARPTASKDSMKTEQSVNTDLCEN